MCGGSVNTCGSKTLSYPRNVSVKEPVDPSRENVPFYSCRGEYSDFLEKTKGFGKSCWPRRGNADRQQEPARAHSGQPWHASSTQCPAPLTSGNSFSCRTQCSVSFGHGWHPTDRGQG